MKFLDDFEGGPSRVMKQWRVLFSFEHLSDFDPSCLVEYDDDPFPSTFYMTVTVFSQQFTMEIKSPTPNNARRAIIIDEECLKEISFINEEDSSSGRS